MRSTSYLPDFSVLASVPDAGGHVEDAELEVCPAPLDGQDAGTSEPPAVAHRGGGQHRSQAVRAGELEEKRMSSASTWDGAPSHMPA